MKRYNPSEIEPKWQKIWSDDARYRSDISDDKPKYYVTGMFPYPSGSGMHVGHFMEHSVVDAVARFRRALGYNVMYPMGWDSFGLPAENYAIKTGISPQKATTDNIASFTNQLKRVGASIDWSREVNTADPKYYKWTQWIFSKLYQEKLAYQKEANQWWCDIDKTVLANEQVVNGKCWRHDGLDDPLVTKKKIKQWFFKITDYADDLLEEIPSLDWPEKIKLAQTNWIGKSEGAEIDFVVEGRQDNITVFSTRPDTIFGATFLVLAPEHPLVDSLVNDETRQSVRNYVDQAIKKSEIERSSEGKEKTGVFSGSYAINPASGEKIPIWIADYVLWGYGTGAIMAVPAHDERDYEFATNYKLPIVQVIMPCDIDTINPPQRHYDEVVRDTVIVHLRDKSTGKYALLNWHGTLEGTTTAIMGGIEPGQTPEDAALMEIREEAGLGNAVIIRQLEWITAAKYCASHKKQNRKAIAHTLLAEVDDLSRKVEVDDYEKTTHTLVWMEHDKIAQLLTPAHQKQVWQLLEESGSLLTGEGELINSGVFDGMPSSEARERIVAWLEQQGLGRPKVTYKMRDWLISRQRYWGAPIPIVHCPDHGAVAVPDSDLPVLLPVVNDFEPKGDGKSPLARVEDWVNTTCPTCGGPAKRETDVMDGYACSSWYLLRYADPDNTAQAWGVDIAKYWQPVDMYLGGDHAVAHLLYVRFWNHVFYKLGLVPTKEPVKKLVYHGLIHAEDGRKMSKSLGNVVDPLEVVDAGYGADALRVFELFVGPIDENSLWSSSGISGVHRFLSRFWNLMQEYIATGHSEERSLRASDIEAQTHRTIKKVTDDIYSLSFNTAIASMMELVNYLYKQKVDGFGQEWRDVSETMVKLIQPFAPHLSAQLWLELGHDSKLDFEAWPTWDESKTLTDKITIIVQVNGKLRAKLEVDRDISEEAVKSLALANEAVQRHLDGEPKKVIYVKGKLVSIVA